MTLTECLTTPLPAPSACYASLYGVSGIVVQDPHGAFIFLCGDEAVRIEAAHLPFLGADVSPPKGRIPQQALAEAVRRVCEAMPSMFYDCGCCGAYHRRGFLGDCRDDAERYQALPDNAVIVTD